MLNIKRINKQLLSTIENNKFTTKIQIFFSSKDEGEFFDSYEKNYTFTNQNPLTIKGYVTEIDPIKLVYKQYGLSEVGMIEAIVNKKYKNWFKLASKIEINNKEYQTFKESQGGKLLITELPLNLIKVVLKSLS